MVTSYSPSGRKQVKPETIEKKIDTILWRGINFPIANLHTTMEQSHIVHEYPDRDSAYVESSGRKPIIVQCTALFLNHIMPGKGETWTQGDLFPNTFKQFMVACQDSSPGILQHPIFGKFTAKCQSTQITLDAQSRGGATVEVSWIETTQIDKQETVSASQIQETAKQMIDELGRVAIVPDTDLSDGGIGFLELIDSISALISLAGMVGKSLIGKIDRALYIVNKLIAACKSFNSNTLGQLRIKAEQMKYVLLSLKRSTNVVSAQQVRTYRTPVDTTCVALARQLNYPLVDFMKANPKVAARPIVPAGTAVLYVKK